MVATKPSVQYFNDGSVVHAWYSPCWIANVFVSNSRTKFRLFRLGLNLRKCFVLLFQVIATSFKPLDRASLGWVQSDSVLFNDGNTDAKLFGHAQASLHDRSSQSVQLRYWRIRYVWSFGCPLNRRSYEILVKRFISSPHNCVLI